jgi:hypothetical protein
VYFILNYLGEQDRGNIHTTALISVETDCWVLLLLFFKNGSLVDSIISAVPRSYIEQRLCKLT